MSEKKNNNNEEEDNNNEKTHKFICEKCNYKSSRKVDYDRHLSTRKHKILIKGMELNEYIVVRAYVPYGVRLICNGNPMNGFDLLN